MINMSTIETNKLNKIYTISLLKTLCVNTKFHGQYAPDILPEYIDGKIGRTLLTIIKDYVNKYERELNLTRLIEEIDSLAERRGLDSALVDLLTEEARIIFETEEGPEQYMIDHLMDFCRRQAMKSALRQAVELLKDNNSDYGQIGKLVDTALTVGAGTDIGYFFEDLYEIQDLYRDKYRPEDLIKTGFPTLDQSLKGGMAPGEVHCCMANPKTGKSTFLSCVTAYNIMMKKTVFHISLEISAVEVLAKIASRITGMVLDDIFDKESPDYTKKMEKYRKRSMNLYVNHWTESTVDSLTLRSWISRIRAAKGVQPSLIIIDYDDCLLPIKKSNKASGDMYGDGGEVYNDLKALASYFQCFSGDTLVSLSSGGSIEIKDIKPGEQISVYSTDFEGKIVVSEAFGLPPIQRTQPMVRVVLNNLDSVDCTADHKFRLQDGTYKEAKDLTTLDQVMNADKIRKILLVVPLSGGPEEVYCISVPDNKNFLLEAGVFVANCPVLTAAQPNRAAWSKYDTGGLMIDSGDLAHSAKKAMKTTSMFSLNFKKDDDFGYLYLDLCRRGVGHRKIPIRRMLDKATFIEGHDSKISDDEG